MALYKLIANSNFIIRVSDFAMIPDDPQNLDYQEYQSWVNEGNFPDTADVYVEPIQYISAWQIREALTQLGWRTLVETAISLSGNKALQDAWEFNTFYYEKHPMITQIAAAIGKTPTDIDDLFTLAKGLIL